MFQLALHSTTLIIWDCKMDWANPSLNLIVTTNFYIKKNRVKINIIY